MRIVTGVAILRRRFVDVAGLGHLIAQPGVAREALLRASAVAQKEFVARLMRLMADGAIAFEERIVREFLERHVMAVVAGLLDGIRFEQKFRVRCMCTMAGETAILQRLMLHGLRASDGVTEGAGSCRIALQRKLVIALVVQVARVAGALSDGLVNLRGARVVGVATGGHAGGAFGECFRGFR